LVIWSFDHLVIGSVAGTVRDTPAVMSELSEALKERSLVFATSVLRLVDMLPNTISGRVVASQLARCATSVASNYRGTCNARSRREFVAKLGVVVEEADESACWLELIRRREMLPEAEVRPALAESIELRNIFGKSVGTARANLRRRATKHPTNQQANYPRTQIPK
jgi:four helix bundle protein